MSIFDLVKESDQYIYDSTRAMAERQAEKADFWKDVEREEDCA